MDPQHLRTCLARFVTGVTVVGYQVDGQVRGLTVNSFTSVSLDPPLVLVSVARSARATRHLGDVPFSVNVLRATQLEHALHFAGHRKEPAPSTWWVTEDQLVPTLTGALVTLQCRPWRSYDGGDHLLHLGHVVQATVHEDGEPLLFDRGQFSCFGAGHSVEDTAMRVA